VKTTTALGLGVLMALPFTLINEGVGTALIGQAFTTFFTGWSKEKVTEGAEKLRDWSKFTGGEENYVITLGKLRRISWQLSRKDFSAIPPAEAKKALEEFTKSSSELLPQFHDMVVAEQPDFEKSFDEHLSGARSTLNSLFNLHNQNLLALSEIKREIAARESELPTAEELKQLNDFASTMADLEPAVASILANWQFYKQTRGEKRPLADIALDEDYASKYNVYLLNMNPALLAQKINEKVKKHVEQLETYSKRAKGEDVEKKDSDLKPEDLIKLEAAPVLVPAQP
jgi:hypothetical protein